MYNNFTQAHSILTEYPKKLEGLMRTLEVSSTEIILWWREEEKNYLNTLSTKNADDVLKMDYLTLLFKLRDIK